MRQQLDQLSDRRDRLLHLTLHVQQMCADILLDLSKRFPSALRRSERATSSKALVLPEIPQSHGDAVRPARMQRVLMRARGGRDWQSALNDFVMEQDWHQ
eukprot:11791272-Alexandrium_andersonii.AAC.1